jgi:hypothetical protein
MEVACSVSAVAPLSAQAAQLQCRQLHRHGGGACPPPPSVSYAKHTGYSDRGSLWLGACLRTASSASVPRHQPLWGSA